MSCEAKELFDTLKEKVENYKKKFSELENKEIEYSTFRNHFKKAEENKLLLRKAHYHNNYIEKMNMLTDYLTVMYWLLLIVYVGKFIMNHQYKNWKKTTMVICFIVIPLAFSTFIGILNFIIKMVKELGRNLFGMVVPMGEFVASIFTTVLNFFGSILSTIMDLIGKILSIIPNLLSAFQRLASNVMPDRCPQKDLLKKNSSTPPAKKNGEWKWHAFSPPPSST